MLYVGNRNTHMDKKTIDQKLWLNSNEFPWLQSRGWTELYRHSGSGWGCNKKLRHMASQYGCKGKLIFAVFAILWKKSDLSIYYKKHAYFFKLRWECAGFSFFLFLYVFTLFSTFEKLYLSAVSFLVALFPVHNRLATQKQNNATHSVSISAKQCAKTFLFLLWICPFTEEAGSCAARKQRL